MNQSAPPENDASNCFDVHGENSLFHSIGQTFYRAKKSLKNINSFSGIHNVYSTCDAISFA